MYFTIRIITNILTPPILFGEGTEYNREKKTQTRTKKHHPCCFPDRQRLESQHHTCGTPGKNQLEILILPKASMGLVYLPIYINPIRIKSHGWYGIGSHGMNHTVGSEILRQLRLVAYTSLSHYLLSFVHPRQQ